MNEMLTEALKVMGIGMGAVFFVLFLFFSLVKTMQKIFPYEEE